MIHKNRGARRDEGVEVFEIYTSHTVRTWGWSCSQRWMALFALLAGTKVIHIDKTSHSKDGENWDMWIFDLFQKIAVYWLSPNGDNVVLQSILGAHNGIIVCNDAQVFRKFRIPRCWAHILNDAKCLTRNFPDNERVLYVSARPYQIFLAAKAFRGTAIERTSIVQVNLEMHGLQLPAEIRRVL